MKRKISWNVKCHEMLNVMKSIVMSNVMKLKVLWNVKCNEMSNVMKCQISWHVKCLLACKLVSFSACASWSLLACYTSAQFILIFIFLDIVIVLKLPNILYLHVPLYLYLWFVYLHCDSVQSLLKIRERGVEGGGQYVLWDRANDVIRGEGAD